MSNLKFRGGASALDKAKLLFDKKHEKVADDSQAAELTGAFALVNPIQTVVGPIGEWVLDIENLPMHPSILIYGKRRTGKSFSARWMLFKCFRDYEFGIVCTG